MLSWKKSLWERIWTSRGWNWNRIGWWWINSDIIDLKELGQNCFKMKLDQNWIFENGPTIGLRDSTFWWVFDPVLNCSRNKAFLWLVCDSSSKILVFHEWTFRAKFPSIDDFYYWYVLSPIAREGRRRLRPTPDLCNYNYTIILDIIHVRIVIINV